MYDAFTSLINYANLYNVLRNANIESSDINQGITFGMLVLS